ncbi:MAG: hypothetical protein GC205_02760 [Bacteroidetes bacterium]|nr:hypothetical protein [Bacteroidota bacterium]
MNTRTCLRQPALFSLLVLFSFSFHQLSAQLCDPSVAPHNLEAIYTPGSGVQLTWDAVPGSAAAQIKLITPSGGSIKKNIVGFEPDAFFIADAFLAAGLYS